MSRFDNMDFEGLLRMAHDRSVEGRTRLATAVGDLYVEADDELTDRERALMTDILDQLIQDVEMSVRRALANRFAKLPNAPRELILKLANEDISIAQPILIESGVLRDAELIDIIHHRTLQHQLAIAMRHGLSEIVSDALVETGSRDVIKTLLENSGARISRATMEYLVDQSRSVNEFQEPLVRRRDLPPELAKKMAYWVSAALRQHILEHYDIDELELEDAIDETVSETVASIDRQAEETKPADKVADLVAREARITPQTIIDTLRRGEIALFEAFMGRWLEVGPEMVRRIVYEPGGEGLAVGCRSLDIPKSDFASIFLLSRKARPGDKTVDPGELQKVLSFYDRVKPDAARAVVQRWRRDPKLGKAIEDVARNAPPPKKSR